MIKFRLIDNNFSGTQMVEVYYNDKLRATINPPGLWNAEEPCIRVVSNMIASVEREVGVYDTVKINFFKEQ